MSVKPDARIPWTSLMPTAHFTKRGEPGEAVLSNTTGRLWPSEKLTLPGTTTRDYWTGSLAPNLSPSAAKFRRPCASLSAEPYPAIPPTRFNSLLAFAKTESNIGAVNLPVKVFCWDG